MENNALEITKLKKKYWKLQALKWVDLTIEQWDFFALLWNNWAGKTTIIWIITDLVKKTSWSVKVFGIDSDIDFSKAKKQIWLVPQEFNCNIFENVFDIPVNQAGYYWIPKKIAEERTEKILRELNLWDKRDTRSKALSGWMKRRLMIARALVHEPKLLILDEPTAWVDVDLRQSMWEYLVKLNKAGTTILLTTHYLEEAEALCNKIAILHTGKIIENTTKSKLLKKLDKEVVIFTPKIPVNKLPKSLNKFQAEITKDEDIELTVQTKKQSINEIFDIFKKEKIEISSIRTKKNRLEELFLKITS